MVMSGWAMWLWLSVTRSQVSSWGKSVVYDHRVQSEAFFFFLIAIISYTHSKGIHEATGHYESALVGSWPADTYIT